MSKACEIFSSYSLNTLKFRRVQ
uniref:Uncharacterized protein n=1 Tax=Rhizophora mucronata TaxID=61149 RepID=A0A2P2QFF8_RHIMU